MSGGAQPEKSGADRLREIALIYHAHLLAAAIETETDARLFSVLPRHGRLLSYPFFDRAFLARQYASYLTVTEYDIACAHVARVVGVTKQTLFESLRKVEDMREAPEIEALLLRIAARAAGRKPAALPASKAPSLSARTAR